VDWFEVGLEDLSDKPTYVQVIASRDGNFLDADFWGVWGCTSASTPSTWPPLSNFRVAVTQPSPLHSPAVAIYLPAPSRNLPRHRAKE